MASRLRSNSGLNKGGLTKDKVVLTKNQPLEIIPPEVVFKDIQVNQYYEITVEIRNLTNHATRIRILQTKNPNLKVLYTLQPQIAPGLSMIAKVKYQCKELKNQTQMIKIVSDSGFVVEFPVRVYKMESQILFQPFVNMGFLKVGKLHNQIISIKNNGKASGSIQFTHPHGSLINVQPKLLKIAAKQQSNITVKYKPVEAGLFKGIINLKSDSILVKDQIDLHATSVDFARFVIDNKGNQTLAFDFGTLLVGQQNIIRAFIVNNSPKKMKFKTFFRKGYLTTAQQFAMVQTPSQIGTQQSERVMFFEPQIGQVEPFKQYEVKIICKTRINYKDRVFTKNYALTSSDQQNSINHMKNNTDFKPENIHQYSVMVNVEQDEPMILQLRANAINPQIKISDQVFKFGDCLVKEKTQIQFTIQNKNSLSKADLTFPKIPNFAILPVHYCLKPKQTHTFKAIFQPQTIGKMDTNQLVLINKLYEVQLRCFGISTSAGSKSRLLQAQNVKQVKKMQPMKTRVKAFSVTQKTFVSQMRKSTQQEQLMKAQHLNNTYNKKVFNQYLVNKRVQRGQKIKGQEVSKRWSLYQNKLKDLGLSSKLQERVDDQGIPQNAPIDYQFQTGIQTTKIANQRVKLPQSKQQLYVVKHIGDYQPVPVAHTSQKYSRSISDAPKRNWPTAPSNYNHKRQVASQLTAQQLAQIQVATNTISFGQVYIKSLSPAYFWIKNSTKKTISIKLIFKDNQLKKSYDKPQIIPSCSEAGFQIIFSKDTLGDFRTNVKYIINDQHQFDMAVTAKCVPVCIQSDKTNIKFAFDQQSLQMSTKETIKLTNPGNSDASFKFALGKDKVFTPTINQGKIKAKQTIQIPIIFTTPEIKVAKSQYVFNERVIVKVLDGAQVPIACNITLHDPKFTIKPFTVTNPSLCVGHQFNDVVEIKNTGKFPTVFHISGKVVEINEKIKMNPDQTKKFKVKFMSKQINTYDAEVLVQPRCGISKTLATTLNVIQPKISFSRTQIDMGILVVQGISGLQKFTVTNQNDIQIPLVIDLRPKSVKDTNPKHIEHVSIKLLDQQQALDVVSPTIEGQDQNNKFLLEGQNLVGQQIDVDELQNSEDDEQEIVQKNEDEFRRYKLPLKPKKVYEFEIQFLPKDVDKYEIEIPFSVQGSHAQLKNTPVILCEGLKPQFLFDPSFIDFKRKIVTKPQRSYPKHINITISNLQDDQCSWQLQDQEIRKQGVFTIEKNKGILKGKQKLQIKASFNPYAIGQYNYKLPLFIRNKTLTQPLKYVDVIMKGIATLPNLYFNKRQVIMPVVPLGIQTISTFKILNDGYENCNLKCQFVDDVANLDVKVLFPQGSNIGITRQKLKVDLVWKYHKPISFCLKLQFTDDLNRTFVIPVSGTTDNCILTNYVYFLRNQNKYSVKTQAQLQLVQNTPEGGGLVRKNSSHSFRSNVTGRSIMSYLGVNPISPAILSNTIDYINRYLNSNMLTSPIRQFPGSFIENDGQQIFEVIQFVSSKNPTYPWRYYPSANQKALNRVNKIYNQYNQLIKLLKIEGAHLNHIRPQYLLSYNDLNLYLSNLPPEKAKYYMPSLLKINTGLYNYLSLQSWITLLYQIFKIYILARVTPKNFKTHLPKIPQYPKFYLQQSNFLSNSQSILFHWVQNAILQVLLQQRRLTNFDKDFKDGVAIAALLQKYAGLNILKKMKMVCTTEEDLKQNAHTVCQGLAQIGLQNHISPKDISNPLQRQMLMFILHLYVYLPFYVPKQDPVVFKCILGQQVIRTIQLTNPSNKPVTYTVKYEGSDDFQLLNQQKFRIQPRQVYKYQVKFISRISNQVSGKIMFINVKQNSLTAAALVFQLKSDIIGRTSDRIWNISGILYEQVQFPIQVYNKFTSAQVVDFTITYQTQYIFQTRGKKNQNPPLSKDQQIQTIYGKQDNIKIRKNGSVSLTLNYIPTSYFTTKTTIFFINSIIGQFQHQIISTVQAPAPIAQIRPPMTLSVDQIVNWQYSVNSKNEQVGRARKAIQSLKRKKGGKQKQKTTVQSVVNELFNVQIAPNPYISAKQSILISEKTTDVVKVKDQKKNSQIVQLQNKLPFSIVCKNPVYQFSTFVIISNKSKTDVRRYKVIFTVQPKALKAILQMNVPARGQVTQNLPIVNNTERDWNIKVQWQPDSSKNGNYFIIPTQYNSSFPVKKNSIGNFPVTFKPKWAYQAQAKLTLTNPLTLDHFQYQILGHGQQPLAEQHIQIKCEAKQIIKKQIIVRNPYQQKPVNLSVETDLMNCQSAKKLFIQSGAKQKFQFTVQPMLCGQYTGSITFFQEDGPQYIWYTVSVITNYPSAYKVLNLETQIRKKILHQIQIPYDHNQQSSFQVVINGVGLIGDPTVSMKPDYNNTYILEYLPLQVGSQKGSICFINPGVGQVLFQLDLICHEKPPIVINNLKSPLGVSTTISAQLQNPTFSKAIVKVINSNPEQFVIKSHTIRLQAQEKKKVQIEYVPASLDTLESAKIVFTSKDIGDWVYELNGTGQMPIPFNTYSVYNGLYQEHSDSVKFRNPFKYQIVVGIKLLDQSERNIFKLQLHGKTKFQLDANGILQIPFSFIPTACKMYSCKIIVLITQKIYWTFPVRGVTQVNQGKVIASLTTPCRQSTSQFVQIGLEGVDFNKGNKFSFSFENIPSQYQKMIEKFLIVDCTKNSLNHAKDMLQFQFLFKPMKPIKISFDFLISKQQGSRWRYRLNLQGTDPQVDDIIDIESNLLVTSTISFKMTNIQKNSTPFKAKFTSDSAHQFSVEPKQGNMAPFGTKGTNFFVSYTPVEYGKEKKGKLIIQTTDMFWSYLLKGSLPKYVPPKLQATRSRIISDKR